MPANYLCELFCGRLAFGNWLQNHLLPCPFKFLTGIDCPGCGFQRSLTALLHGDISDSFHLYPATIPLIIFSLFGLADKFFNIDNSNHRFKKAGFMLVGVIILISYSIKMGALYMHYIKSA